MSVPRPKAEDRRDPSGFVSALADYLDAMSPEDEARLERALSDDREHGPDVSPEERTALERSR